MRFNLQHGWSLLQEHEDRDFLLALIGSLGFYAFVALLIHTLPVSETPREDFKRIPPHIAKLILEVPQPPPLAEPAIPGPTAPALPKGEEGAARKPPPAEDAQTPKQPAENTSPRESGPPPRQEARVTPEEHAKALLRRNREIAMQSGLLRLLTREDNAGNGAKDFSQDEKLKKVLNPAAALGSIHASSEKEGEKGPSRRKGGSGGIDNLIAALKDQGSSTGAEGLIGGVGERRMARVESPFEIRGAAGQEATRSYESIREVVDSLTGWIRFVYNRSLRENPALKGTVTIEFSILPGGEVSGCRVASSSLKDPDLEEQLVRRFRQLKFPAGAEGIHTIIYPITLIPSG